MNKTQSSVPFHADGETFDLALDGERLKGQFERVKTLMLDEKWRTLAQITQLTGGSEAAISARLRDLRKIRFGSYTVERRRKGIESNGVFEYRVLPPKKRSQAGISTKLEVA